MAILTVLADLICDCPSTDGPLLEALGEAARFEFSEVAASAAHQIADGKFSSFINGLPLLKAPFPTVWIETRASAFGVANVDRLGALIRERGDDLEFLFAGSRATTFRVLEPPEHFRAKGNISFDGFAQFKDLYPGCISARSRDGSDMRAVKTEAELRALYELVTRTASSSGPDNQAFVDLRCKLLQSFLSALMLLNSRTCIDITPAHQDREIQSRRSRGLGPPLARQAFICLAATLGLRRRIGFRRLKSDAISAGAILSSARVAFSGGDPIRVEQRDRALQPDLIWSGPRPPLIVAAR